jgi:hypothetical protein
MNAAAIKAGYERLKACVSHDTCEKIDCLYFTRPEELKEVLSFLEGAIAGAETCNSYNFEGQGPGSAGAFLGDQQQGPGSAAAPPEGQGAE